MGSTLVGGTTCIRSIDVFRRSQLFSDFLRMTSIDHVLARVYWTRASTCIKYTCYVARVRYTRASTCVYARARPLLAKMRPGGGAGGASAEI